MKKIILFFCILASPAILAGNFERFISYIKLLPLNERQAKADSFMKANPILPYLEDDTTVFFIYQGNAQNVVIAGDFTGWTPSMPMTGVEGTDIFYRAAHFEADARIEYKFVVNSNWILDPKNPHSFTGGTGINSEVRMPALCCFSGNILVFHYSTWHYSGYFIFQQKTEQYQAGEDLLATRVFTAETISRYRIS